MRKTVVMTIVGLGLGAPLLAMTLTAGYEPAGLDDLHKEKGAFKTTLVRPDADLASYTKIQPMTVALLMRDPGAANEFSTGRLLAKREKESVIPQFDEVVEFKRIVGEVLASEIAENTDLEVVDSAGPSTLILQPMITDVIFSSSSKNRSEDGRELPVLDEGVIVFDLIDGETGTIVARFGEKRRCKPPKGAERSSGLWPNLEHWAELAAADLCRELHRFEEDGSKTS